MKSSTTKHDAEMQQFCDDLLTAAREMKAGRAARVIPVDVPLVVQARQASGLSQAQFAAVLGISVRTLQKWEQGERHPSGAAASLIKIAAKHPDWLRVLEAA